ncbi:Copper chaperone CopZ [Streptomyces sp. 3213]|nr:Copper chaperone CopZ [Streptomyces sp. 3213] [Streptomyces sp. 3213.3]
MEGRPVSRSATPTPADTSALAEHLIHRALLSGMTCGHCENAMRSAIALDDARMREAIDEAGYEPTGRL